MGIRATQQKLQLSLSSPPTVLSISFRDLLSGHRYFAVLSRVYFLEYVCLTGLTCWFRYVAPSGFAPSSGICPLAIAGKYCIRLGCFMLTSLVKYRLEVGFLRCLLLRSPQ